ncbi:MAG: hypothetical protein HOK61_00290 [Alphaproteobacteria bacterium]|jgi:carbon-monoxide dehydrogenase medium subunit|nr:hypothetical protein [Alphaproteobacteria bacterium]
MYPAPIEEYVRPGTVDEAIAALAKYPEGDAFFVAGGQSIMQAIKSRLLRPRCIVDLQGVSGLKGITADSNGVRIGAMTRYREIAEAESLNGAYQAMRDAADRVGDRQVRNRGTIGGSLCWNYVAACMPPVTMSLGAEMELIGAGGASRSVAANDFLLGPLETAREENEILLSINMPAAPANAGSAYKKWGLVTDALPVIGVCAYVELDGSGACTSARVAIGGLGDGPAHSGAAAAALVGNKGNDADAISAALDAAANETETQGDLWADPAYRKQLIRSLGTEVVTTAFQRAAS